MRPGQNKRMRGRNNNNNGGRKGPNPLTRSYESNGPDVKIRGTAQHIGEKYLQLARDAQTSGDPVAAESYLQHAEHYFRLIAAAQQAQFQAQNGFARQGSDADADEGDDDDESGGIPDRFALPSERIQPPPPPAPYPPPPQPYGERQNGPPYPERQDRQDRPEGQDRPYWQDRFNNNADRDGGQRGPQDRGGQPNVDRGDRNNSNNYDRNTRNDRNRDRNRVNRDGGEFRENRDPQYREQPRLPQPRDPAEVRLQPPAPQPVEAGPDLPAFITAPVRSAPVAPEPEERTVAAPDPADVPTDAAADQFAVRPRRRRRARTVAPGEVEGSVEPVSEAKAED
jgi:Domain of unknown function (DUF4167)